MPYKTCYVVAIDISLHKVTKHEGKYFEDKTYSNYKIFKQNYIAHPEFEEEKNI